jgi:hypothetical protein
MDNHKNKLSLDDLKGKQSVRATFRLPKQVIELLSVIASQLGIKQKSLFDQLVEDPSILKKIAREIPNSFADSGERVQKTYVISRSSLLTLERIARNQEVPRDVLVEISINRLLPIIESELEKHEKRKILLKEMQMYLKQGRQILKKTEQLFSSEDQLYQMVENQIRICEKNVAVIRELIKKGKPMENW